MTNKFICILCTDDDIKYDDLKNHIMNHQTDEIINELIAQCGIETLEYFYYTKEDE